MASISQNISGQKKVGRPRNENLYGGHIRSATNTIADRLPELIENLFRLAGGVWFEETTKEGSRVVYRKEPCRQSNEYLINRIMGKPIEFVQAEIDDDGNKEIKLRIEVPDVDERPKGRKGGRKAAKAGEGGDVSA